MANSYKNLHDSKKIGFVLPVRSKFVCCRFAFAEPLNWFDERSALANHKRRKNMFSFSQSGTKYSCFVCFPALDTGCMILCAWHRLSFSCVWNRLHDFPRLPPVARFPVFGIDCLLFPAFATGCTISRLWYRLSISRVCHRLHDFPRLTSATYLACSDWLVPLAVIEQM